MRLLLYFGPPIFALGAIIGGEYVGWVHKDVREFFWRNVNRRGVWLPDDQEDGA